MLILADRGELDLDAPVARYWPEFAAAGYARAFSILFAALDAVGGIP